MPAPLTESEGNSDAERSPHTILGMCFDERHLQYLACATG